MTGIVIKYFIIKRGLEYTRLSSEVDLEHRWSVILEQKYWIAFHLMTALDRSPLLHITPFENR